MYCIKFHHIFQKTRFRFIFLNHNSEWQNFLLTRLSTAFFFHTKHKSRHLFSVYSKLGIRFNLQNTILFFFEKIEGES